MTEVSRYPGHLSLVAPEASGCHGAMTGRAGNSILLSTVDLATRERLPQTCPACGVVGLEVRSGAERAVLVCRRCQGAWVVEMGYLVPLGAVAPA